MDEFEKIRRMSPSEKHQYYAREQGHDGEERAYQYLCNGDPETAAEIFFIECPNENDYFCRVDVGDAILAASFLKRDITTFKDMIKYNVKRGAGVNALSLMIFINDGIRYLSKYAQEGNYSADEISEQDIPDNYLSIGLKIENDLLDK